MILYGIPTCDTCKKALKALEAAGQAVTFPLSFSPQPG
mgnify:CR=1 FL=1